MSVASGPAVGAGPATAPAGGRVGGVVAQHALPLLLAVLLLAASVTTSGFLTFDNLRAVLITTAITGIAAVGMTTVTLSGNMFSLGAGQSAMLASTVFTAVAVAGSPLGGAVAALLVLVALGLAQSVVIAAGLNPVVTTLAFGTVIFGAVSGITGGAVLPVPGGLAWIAGADLLRIPLPVWVFFAFTITVQLLVDRTGPGRRMVLVGANRRSAVMSGVSVRTATVWAFGVFSLALTIAGIVSASQLGQVTPANLSTLTLDAVAAVLVGGAAVSGGRGSAVGSALGALVIVVLADVMLLQGFSTGARVLGQGTVVVLVVAVLHLARRGGRR